MINDKSGQLKPFNINKRMRIISFHVLKWAQQNSLFLGSAFDLSFISFYQRPFYRQTLIFGVRTVANRSTQGSSLVVHLPGGQARCFIKVQKDGIAFAALVDESYPQRVAFMALKRISQQFSISYEASQFSKIEKDDNIKWGKLQEFLKKFQDPKQVDKLLKLLDQLKQVEELCHKNLDELMKRGQNLERLMEKSKDVSTLSFDLFKQAKKANSRCCSLS